MKSYLKKEKILFEKTPAFGTGGIRALMGEKPGCFHLFAVYKITQALANYLHKQFEGVPLKVVIGYDNRKKAKFFARKVASVLSANEIKAYLFPRLRPTPMVSFATIHYQAHAAVMITASHNPPEYNGYKIYWEGGAQIVSPHDVGIAKEMKKITSLDQVKKQKKKEFLFSIPTHLDNLYQESLKKSSLRMQENQSRGSSLHIVYTGLHGTGCEITPKALKSWGFSSLSLVEKQCKIDPSFSYAKKPNPEEKEALEMGASQLLQEKGDLLLANDPDADRIGVAIRDKEKILRFSGNQIACLLLFYILKNHSHLPKNSAFIKTIVTSDLFDVIASFFHKKSFEVLTGFKYIAEKIALWQKNKEYTYILGVEESLGYLMYDSVKDKDGVQASCLVAEMALSCKEKGKTLYDFLLEIYQKFGVFREDQVSLHFSEGEKGIEERKIFMEKTRKNPFSSLLGKKVLSLEDFLQDPPSAFPPSDVLRFYLEDKTKIVIRPSGTEPKIKIYLEVQKKGVSLKQTLKESDLYLKKLKDFFKKKSG